MSDEKPKMSPREVILDNAKRIADKWQGEDAATWDRNLLRIVTDLKDIPENELPALLVELRGILGPKLPALWAELTVNHIPRIQTDDHYKLNLQEQKTAIENNLSSLGLEMKLAPKQHESAGALARFIDKMKTEPPATIANVDRTIVQPLIEQIREAQGASKGGYAPETSQQEAVFFLSTCQMLQKSFDETVRASIELDQSKKEYLLNEVGMIQEALFVQPSLSEI